MTAHRGRVVTQALLTVLSNAGITAGDGVAPDGVGWDDGTPGVDTFDPYVVVHATLGGIFDGSVGDPYQDAKVDYTLTSVGATQQQAQWMNDEVYATLTSTALTVSGRSVLQASPEVEGGATRDDDVQPPVWFAPSRWRIYTTTT